MKRYNDEVNTVQSTLTVKSGARMAKFGRWRRKVNMYHLSPMGQEMAQGREDADRTDGGTENSDRTAGGEEKVRESDTKRAKSFPVLAENRIYQRYVEG